MKDLLKKVEYNKQFKDQQDRLIINYIKKLYRELEIC